MRQTFERCTLGFLFASIPRVNDKEEKYSELYFGTWECDRICAYFSPLAAIVVQAKTVSDDGIFVYSKRMENVVVALVVVVAVVVGIVDVDYSFSFPSTYERFPNAKRENRHWFRHPFIDRAICFLLSLCVHARVCVWVLRRRITLHAAYARPTPMANALTHQHTQTTCVRLNKRIRKKHIIRRSVASRKIIASKLHVRRHRHRHHTPQAHSASSLKCIDINGFRFFCSVLFIKSSAR